MTSIFQKLENFGGALVHELFDTATDGWDVAKLKQYIRDVEGAERDLVNNLSDAQGALAVTMRKVGDTNLIILSTEEDIETLLTDADPSNDHFANPLGLKLSGLREQKAQLERRLTSEELIVSQMQQGLAMLREKLIEKRQQVRELEFAATEAEAMSNAGDALENAMGVLDGGDVASIDSLSDKVEREQAAARARFTNLTAGRSATSGAEAALAQSRGQSEVERIRARIAARNAGNAEAAAS